MVREMRGPTSSSGVASTLAGEIKIALFDGEKISITNGSSPAGETKGFSVLLKLI